MKPKFRLLAGTGLAVPLLIPSLAAAGPAADSNPSAPHEIPSLQAAPLTDSQLDGVTAGGGENPPVIYCIKAPCNPAPNPRPPIGWHPKPPVHHPKDPPLEVTSMCTCEEGGGAGITPVVAI